MFNTVGKSREQFNILSNWVLLHHPFPPTHFLLGIIFDILFTNLAVQNIYGRNICVRM